MGGAGASSYLVMKFKVIALFICVCSSVNSNAQIKGSQINLDQKRTVKKEIVNKIKWGVGGALWGESLTLLKTGGATYPLKSNAYSFSLSVSKDFRWLTINNSWQATLLTGQINVSQDSSNLSYYKRGTNFIGTAFGIQNYFFAEEKVRLGISLDILYRYGMFSNPDSQSVFESKHLASGLLGLSMSWKLHRKVWLEQKFATSTSLKEPFWHITFYFIR